VHILVTGAAGFIGHALSARLLSRGDDVVGIDNLNPYYAVKLKEDRIADLSRRFGERFVFLRLDFADAAALSRTLNNVEFSRIAHMGAQAGVRYSLTHPEEYVRANLAGHLNMLELARGRRSEHFVYASSSSVYGSNEKLPFAVEDRVDSPVSLYAATKRAGELMSESYSHLYRLPQTGLRFFTVYGPWGRPDMTPWLFTEAILSEKPIRLFNNGRISRDFTYIDDIVDGIVAALDGKPDDDGQVKAGGSLGPHRIYNLGNAHAEPLAKLVEAIETATGRKAKLEFDAMQPGDVKDTFADIQATERDLGYRPQIGLETGIARFVDWFRTYRGV